jgi:hypothetical protein
LVTGVRLHDSRTDARSDLPVEELLIMIGYRPNTGASLATWPSRRDLLADRGVFVAGNVLEHRPSNAVTAADAELWLAEHAPVAPRTRPLAWARTPRAVRTTVAPLCELDEGSATNALPVGYGA